MKTHLPTLRAFAGITYSLVTLLLLTPLLRGVSSFAAFPAEHPQPVQPNASFVVNDPADPGNPTCSVESCSLRAAITAANADPEGEHTVNFDLTYPVTITLGSLLPVISTTLDIQGPGASELTISGAGTYLVFQVGSGANLSMKGVAIRQGYGLFRGAALLNDHGTLTITDSLIADNSNGGGDGGGLYNDGGVVNISTTTFSENDAFDHGAIFNSGMMTITNSLFMDNFARTGGAISNSGALTVQSSTFTGNIASQIGGGAIENQKTLVLVNSTFFRNGSTIGADILNGGALHVTNSTFYSATLPSLDSIHFSVISQTVGVSNTIGISNTILAAGNGIANCGGVEIVNLGMNNLSTDSTCGGAVVVTLDELNLGTLQNNGGSTPTIALLPGSVAIDAGNAVICAAPVGPPFYGAGGEDQRGVSRPQGEQCDVGAFEYSLLLSRYLPLLFQASSSP